MRVAVVGSGVSGLTAAYVISRRHHVTLYEKDGRFGGHANTVAVPGAAGEVGLDTGFIVHNERTYPHLLRLFRELGVSTQSSDMSFGVRCEQCGLEYAGARGLAGVAATPRKLMQPEYLRMLVEVKRFHHHARTLLRDAEADRMTLGEFLDRGRYSPYFHDHYMLPLTGAIWSCAAGQMREFPARYLIRFFANHGMLTVKHSPAWKTVTGGSRVYVNAVVSQLAHALAETGVTAIERDADGVTVTDVTGAAKRFDRVVLATHPDQALRLLADPTPAEQRVLGSFSYSANETVLHTDGSLLPRSPGARASWNYLLEACSTTRPMVAVTYHLNRLQALDEPTEYCVTLNQSARITPGTEISRMVYEHPIYTLDSLEAQRRLPTLSGVHNTAYCGAYHGWGFHEDGCVSGVRAALALGCAW
ncbi:MAG TPA: FAD-dependent oxidoreductase [Gaiellales bacterium]|nr:FAD-dependent oxidoreductase [Gaiellales bacterium]